MGDQTAGNSRTAECADEVLPTPTRKDVSAMLIPVRQMREEMRRRTHRWAVVLDDCGNPSSAESENPARTRPKADAFSSLQERLDPSVHRTQTLLLLCPEHAWLGRDQARRYSDGHILTLPSHCGTVPAMLWALLHVRNMDPEAVISFFPLNSDCGTDANFTTAIDNAFSVAQSNFSQDSVIVLGSSSIPRDSDCGWIEPKPSLLGCSGGVVRQVLRFWDDPSRQVAETLLRRGCLVNTSVLIGRCESFLALVRAADPEFVGAFEATFSKGALAQGSAKLENYSSEVPLKRLLTVNVQRLLVLPLREAVKKDTSQPVMHHTVS